MRCFELWWDKDTISCVPSFIHLIFSLYQRNSLLFHLENSRSAFHWMRSQTHTHTHEDDRMNSMKQDVRFEYTISVIFVVLVGLLRWHSFDQGKKTTEKLLTFQIRRTKAKAKPNQTESQRINTNKQNDKMPLQVTYEIFFFPPFIWMRQRWKGCGTHAYIHMIGRSFI